MLTVVLPFCEKDAELALEVLATIRYLDSKLDTKCLLVTDDNCPDSLREQVKSKADSAFSSVVELVIPIRIRDGWPRSANIMFAAAIRYVEDNQLGPFLWMEPDCVPLKPEWLSKLGKQYFAHGKPFMGHVEPYRDGDDVLYGTAVYPQDANSRLQDTIIEDLTVPWDMSCRGIMVPECRHSPLVWCFYGEKDCPPTFVPGNGNSIRFKRIPPAAVLFHRCKDGSLHRIIQSKIFSNGESTRFYHNGDLGDIIYALPTIRAMGGGTIVLGPCKNVAPFITRERMTRQRAGLIIPLLESQDYIDSAVFTEGPSGIDVDLNHFRELIHGGNFARHKHTPLAHLHLLRFDIPLSECDKSWLDVSPKHVARCVFARSERYHRPGFSYAEFVKAYAGDSVFIGSEREHLEFCSEFGDVPYYRTPTLLQAAEVIAGSDLFVGNQSSPFALAEGMKHDAVLEVFDGAANCSYHRPGLSLNGFVTSVKRAKPKKKIDAHILYDTYSGLGRVAVKVVNAIQDVADVSVIPTRRLDIVPDAPKHPLAIGSSSSRSQRVLVDAVEECASRINKGDIVFTMWELCRLSPAVVSKLNLAGCIIVPSSWCASVFSACGVNAPIKIVPLSVDTSVFSREGRLPPRNVKRIGCAARFTSDGYPRKGLQRIIDAFDSEFSLEEDVFLDVKGYGECTFTPPSNRVSIIDRFMSDGDLADWYRSLDAFVNVSTGGGWELHLHEAMACGCVPVSMTHSSSMEFFNETNGYPVRFTFVNDKRKGIMAVPDKHDLGKCMRLAIGNGPHNSVKSDRAFESACRFSDCSVSRVIRDTVLNLL